MVVLNAQFIEILSQEHEITYMVIKDVLNYINLYCNLSNQ